MALRLGLLGDDIGAQGLWNNFMNDPFDDDMIARVINAYQLGYIDGTRAAQLLHFNGGNGFGFGRRRRQPRGRLNVNFGYRYGQDWAAVNPMMLGMDGLGGGLGLGGLGLGGVGYDAAILGNQHLLMPPMGMGRLWI